MNTQVNRPGLEALIAPVTPSEFLEKYWARQPFIQRGPLTRFPLLHDCGEILSIEKMVTIPGAGVKVTFADKGGTIQVYKTTPDVAIGLFNKGVATVGIDGMHTGNTVLKEWIVNLAQDLKTKFHHFSVNAFASVAPAGTAMHFDAQEIFTLQIKGRKKWTIAPNKHLEHPPASWGLGRKVPASLQNLLKEDFPDRMPAEAQTVVMEPGTLLFMPRGHWHSTETLEDSIHINFSLVPYSRGDVLIESLRNHLMKSGDWRRPASGYLDMEGELNPTARELLEAFGGLSWENLFDKGAKKN